ncbi:MAG: DUF5658 family protein [Methanomicrobiales archaeon]|nr:DUF5658 family protein [Methanomicrobiales archaeon]
MKFRHIDISLLLILLIASLSLVDVITTGVGIRNGYHELNPFIAPYVQDPVLFLGIKATGLLLIVVLAVFSRWINHHGDHILLGTVCGINFIPAFWNITVLSAILQSL